jgi:predicted ArsR family transcriptional regulator
VTAPLDRHRLLAGVSRSRLLTVLRRSAQPMGVRDLADAVDLHPNTAREHLEQLVAAGLVFTDVARSGGRGRPSIRYHLASEAADDDAAPYRALAAVLADELARRPDSHDAARSAGERWGRALAGAATDTGADAVTQLVALLDDAGFSPETPADAREPIRLHACPFGQLARDRQGVVCGVHLGLMRGALEELGAPYEGVRLEPFVEPRLCLAHVGARP